MESVDLGVLIRQLRVDAGLSLAAAGRLTLMSKSSFHRLETGARDVTPDDVAAIEAQLGLGGRLAAQYHRRRLEDYTGRVDPAALWVHAFPSAWAGPVWIFVRAPALAEAVDVEISWGSWARTIRAPTPRSGLTLLFGKGGDGESIPLSVRVEPASVVSFGFGPAVAEPCIDVNDNWVYDATESKALERVASAFEALLVRNGKTAADLALVLGLTEHELRGILHLPPQSDSPTTPP